jgi:hypothetical protein
MEKYKAQIQINNHTLNNSKFKEYLINAKENINFSESFKKMYVSSPCISNPNIIEVAYGFRLSGSFQTIDTESSTPYSIFKTNINIHSILSLFIFYKMINFISNYEQIEELTVSNKDCFFLLKNNFNSILPFIKSIDSNDKSILINPIENLIKLFEMYPELKETENPKDIKYIEMLK